MSRRKELEELTDNWLEANDPYYTDSERGKRKKLEYSYETRRQKQYRSRKELTFSRLYKSRLMELQSKDVDISDYLDEQE